MEEKLKHLDIIQGVVNRLADCSFKLKGWSVTLVVGLLALSLATKDKIAMVALSFIPLIVFWILDGYYLWQERLFRALYVQVSKITKQEDIDFSMDTSSFIGEKRTLCKSILSFTLILFYLSLLVVMIGVIIYLASARPVSGTNSCTH